MKNISRKLFEIQKEIDVQPKEGYNEFNNYPFLTEKQVTILIKGLMDKHGVRFEYSSEEKSKDQFTSKSGGIQFLVTVEVTYAFEDVDSGEIKCGKVTGWGSDSGDKGGYKAVTGAIKYLYMKTFNIPTGDDAEKDSPELGKKVVLSNKSDSPF